MTRKHRLGVTAIVALGGASCCALVLAACSLPTTTSARPPAPVHAAAAPADQRIAQLEFGRSARFALCVEPTCPAVTRKTLAVAAIPAAQPMATEQLAAPTVEPTPVAKREPSIAADQTTPPHKLVLHFSTDSAALTATHKSLLRTAISELRKTDRIVIVGRTDNLGSEARNQSLAFARAIAIRDHLLDLAPDLPARIAIDAKGLCCYAAPNETADGRAQNRRVELVFRLRSEVRP
jgi:outer membrane protein OmpA-like peptidoglycan-associated protein